MRTIEPGLLFLLTFSYIFGEVSSLQCHKCVSTDCPGSYVPQHGHLPPLQFCEDVRHFVIQKLDTIYFKYGPSIPPCPSPNDQDGWRTLAKTSCPDTEDSKCAIGRFKIFSTIQQSNTNITSYGTSLGCLAKDETSVHHCRFDKESVKNSDIRHELDIEHCRTAQEMCRDSDFCIKPEATVIKKFRDDIVKSNKAVRVFFGGLFVLVIIIAILCVLGIKYDGGAI